MRSTIVRSLVLAAIMALSACAPQHIPAPPPPEVVASEKQDSPHHLERTNTVKVTAVVTDIDVDKRLVTLKGPDGNEETIAVGPEVRNLPQVKRGDHVVVTYYESTVFQLYKAKEVEPGVGAAQTAARAKLGEKPGAAGAEAISVTATVEKVDKTKPSLTLKMPDGKVVTFPVRDASKLDPVKVGDLLEITYTRALAVAVETPQNP